MTTTWTIAVDWDRDGNFSGQNDDVTVYVSSARWFLGERKPYQDTADDSMLTLVLDNSDRRFSPENPSSPLAGKLVPFRPVRVQSDDGNTTRTHWVGWIESIQPQVNVYGERTVEITAAGPMQFFKAAETALELQENLRTDEIIAELIKEVVIPRRWQGHGSWGGWATAGWARRPSWRTPPATVRWTPGSPPSPSPPTTGCSAVGGPTSRRAPLMSTAPSKT
ncbi:MAG: hypothetical protein M5U05_18305 [Anaerolineales bacterium]|nr:hypothetical protein [Anaerolineales bacterium]